MVSISSPSARLNNSSGGARARGSTGHGKLGLLEGNATTFVNQILATLITWVFALIGAFVLLKITDLLVGLRVRESDEFDGLDLSQHGESGYNFEEAYSAALARRWRRTTSRGRLEIQRGIGIPRIICFGGF